MSFKTFLQSINPFKRAEKKPDPRITDKDRESFAKIVLDKKKTQTPKKKHKTKTEYEIGGHLYKIGDKVICRSNEPHPLWVGKIVEFWDNKGKWETAVPRVRNIRTGKIWGVNGVIKPYSEELMNTLRPLKPLEQWNYLVPEEARYSEEQMLKKEEFFKKREKFSKFHAEK